MSATVADLNKTITKAADMFNNGIPIQLLTDAQKDTLKQNLEASIETVKPTRKHYVEQIIKVLDNMVSIQNASRTLKQQTKAGKFFTPAYKTEASSEQYKTLRDELNKIKYTEPTAADEIFIFPNSFTGKADDAVTFWKNHLLSMNATAKTATLVINRAEYPLDSTGLPLAVQSYDFVALADPAASGSTPAASGSTPAASGSTPAANDNTGGGGAAGGSSSRKTRNKRRRRRRATRRW